MQLSNDTLQVHIETVTVSAAAQNDLTSCFSATYPHYVIFYSITQSTNGSFIEMQLLTSGTPSTTGYYQAGETINNSGAQGTIIKSNGSEWRLNGAGSNNWNLGGVVHVLDPFENKKTNISGQGNWVTDSNNGDSGFAGVHNVTASYNGFRMKVTTGNFSGVVRVFGYQA